MESVRRWVSKFRTQDKHKSSKKESATNGKEGSKALTTEEAPSNATKQKVAAAKQYIEKHYKEQMKNLQERKERPCEQMGEVPRATTKQSAISGLQVQETKTSIREGAVDWQHCAKGIGPCVLLWNHLAVGAAILSDCTGVPISLDSAMMLYYHCT
ncbi:AGC (cAMP-dependent, cGMP-dependent and protein kinase C) kinase family protein [Actinidia rufa]|uniref:AGC (cAMP-dependent, cGMP-dependent and protein kinase C) kinase family protein n=1 Tax=Actinidia rufa TaxID=165716 RepID=A0A7J0DB85_9ERIC|nr:AGC (cAMP-dependent, cGMP-dependent and protein kinase C) kinase family protein [Actinidia rufa]